jgi:ABC-type multidrug transport system fused ATPase/permease subunit
MEFSEWRRLVDTYLRPHTRLVALLALALFSTIAMQVGTPQIIRAFINRATTPDGGPLLALTVIYIAAVLLQQAVRIVATWLGELVGWLTTNSLRADLLAHCLALDPDFHKTRSPGELIERVDGDVHGLSQFFAGFLLNVIGNVLLLIGVLVVVWIQSPFAAGIISVFALVALATLVGVRRVAVKAWGRAREASALLFGFIEERLAGTQDIRSSAAERYTLRGFYERSRTRTWATSHARVMDAIPWATNGVVVAATTAIAFVVPTILVRRGEITLGDAFALYFYTQLLIQPLANMSHQVEQLQQAIAGGRRVLELLRIESTIVDGEVTDLPAGPLSVSLANVHFGYGDEPNVLHDVTIDVAPGEVLGIVGRTGSGKSSLARLLVRLHDPRQGRVEIGGIDVRLLRRHALRDRVALVTQEVHVLRASVRDNLTLFDQTIPDDEVLGAVEQLGLLPWFAKLPDGLDTIVREGGAGLSAGESQLLSFGRAFLARPSVVILDEASSRLDPATEAMLEGAIDTLLAGRTGIVIAHRLATLQRCDTVCVLDNGQVVEHGDRETLAMDASSRFGVLLRTGLDVVAG